MRTSKASRTWSLLVLLVLWAVPATAQPVEVALFEGGEGVEFYQSVAREFRDLTGLDLRLEADPRIADRVRIRCLEGDFPAVSNANVDIWSLIEHDQILPLDEALKGPDWSEQGRWGESFLPGSLNQYRYQGRTYGIPLVYVVWSVYYNKAVFRRHGWDPPRTWPEFLQLCEEMEAQGVAPMAFQGRYPFYAQALVKHTYYHLVGPERYDRQQAGAKGSFDNPEMVKALKLFEHLADNHFQPGALGMSHTEAQLEFFQGRSAMLMCGSWLYSEMQDNIPADFELGAFPLPLPESPHADPRAAYATSGYFFVFKNSDNPSGGVDFLRYLTSGPVAGRFARRQGITVAVEGANGELHPQVQDVAEQLETIETTFGSSSGPTLTGLDQVWTDVLSRLLNGSVEAAEAARQMEQAVAVLREARERPEEVEVRHPGKALLFGLLVVVGLALGMGRSAGSASEGATCGPATASRFLLPSLLVYSGFLVLPSAAALLGCFFRWDGLGEPEFVGTLHFRRLLLESDGFWTAFGNNLFLMTVIPAVVLPLSLYFANCLHHGVRGARLYRVAFFFPNLLGVAGILLWQQLYNPTGGPINRLLGLGSFAWLSPDHLYYALIPMGVWGACGFNMILFLAAMQGVNPSLYEAAELSGADGWQKFRHITLPGIWETVIAAVIFMIISGMKAFEAIWLLTNQAPTTDTHVIGTLMVRSMFGDGRIGQAAAIACLLFVTVLVGSLLAGRFSSEDAS